MLGYMYMKKMKPIKVFFMGKKMNEIYPYATKWEVAKYRIGKAFARIIKITAVLTFIAGIVYGSFHLGLDSAPTLSYAKGEVVDTLTPKVEQLKEELLDTLKKCESSQATEDDAIIIVDTNNKLSYGTLMFQRDTVKYYYKSLYNKDITNKEAVEIALDNEQARALALDIMFKSSNKANDWHNCAVKHGLNAKIDLIKSLQK